MSVVEASAVAMEPVLQASETSPARYLRDLGDMFLQMFEQGGAQHYLCSEPPKGLHTNDITVTEGAKAKASDAGEGVKAKSHDTGAMALDVRASPHRRGG
ncbi:hypothetical protein GUJ93_ZPchr0007g5856 [Zizania palustris]|uniref:Uncharacterized protein n=1 Tax=Zizania palustris TaxID=103762 RepID=A0A8J5T6X8_ZIZPA|nr:hypothetical protein GUJ93_ZPchr0007g5856 [Zizania palustris]